MKHCDLLTALSLTLGTAEHAHGIALKSYRQITRRHSKIALTQINQMSNNKPD